MDTAQWVLIAAVVVFTLVCAAWDLRTKKLPNWLTVPAFAAGLLFHGIVGALAGGFGGMGSELLFALGGFATGFGILLVLWLIGGGGAGDVKMMGALGAWLGAKWILWVFLVSTVLIIFASAGALTWQMVTRGFGYTRRRYLSPKNESNLPRNEARREEVRSQKRTRRRLMPYAVPVALATWAVLWLAIGGRIA